MTRRVLFMINSMAGGGSERQTALLLQHLDRQAFEPELFLTHRSGPLLGEIPSDVKVHSFDDAPPSSGLYYPGKELRRQIRYVIDLIRQRSVDVIYDRTFHMTLLAGPAAHATGVHNVSTIVSPPHVALPMVEKKFVFLKRKRLSKAYSQSGQVVAVSKQAALSAEAYYGLPKSSVQVISNPVDLERVRAKSLQPADPPITRQENRIHLVVVARMSEEKGHADFLAALQQTATRWPQTTPMLHVWLIGDGVLRAELETKAAQMNCGHTVEFLGLMSNPAPHIAAADALVLPSHFEGMPNVVLEAMTLNTPVIATSSGGTVELQADEPTILFAKPQDPKSLADQILNFFSDRESANVRRDAATRYVNANHDIQKTIVQIQDLLLLGSDHSQH